MESSIADNLSRRLILLAVVVIAASAAVILALPQPAQADAIAPPPVPANIQVPEGYRAFFVGHATGTQNYVCLPSGAGVGFTLFTPQATLFNPADGKQAATHFFSPNPEENGVIRATWQHSRDTSTVWGRVFPDNFSTDPLYVAPGAIPWLLVTVVGTQAAPSGSDTLSAAAFIQRVNTTGGLAPTIGCATLADIGNQAFVPYTADYFFFKPSAQN